MAMATGAAIAGGDAHSFPLFFGAFMVGFPLAGVGNGSTYRMIPAIFAALGGRDAKRRGAGAMGIAGAVGAFGGFLIRVVLRQASLSVAALVKGADTPAEKVAIAHAHADWSVP